MSGGATGVPRVSRAAVATAFLLAVCGGLVACGGGPDAGDAPAPPGPETAAVGTDVAVPAIPDVELVDHRGRPVRFYRDLVRGRVVAMSFVFTTCATICPPISANFAALEQRLAAAGAEDVELLSVSVDPAVDTPERLAAWHRKFEGGERWTLLTGDKRQVDRLLKALGVFSAEKADHAPLLLLGNEATGRWRRADAFTAPETLAETVLALRAEPGRADRARATAVVHPYFPDTELIDQHGERLRFYSDLVHDKIVVIQVFFSSCTGSCPVLLSRLATLQAAVGERMGRDVVFLSITVDAGTDTPARLAAYAEKIGAGPGWHLLTGPKVEVDRLLAKLGFAAEEPDLHKSLLVMGNTRTGLWKKAQGLASPQSVLAVFESVLSDRGEPDERG